MFIPGLLSTGPCWFFKLGTGDYVKLMGVREGYTRYIGLYLDVVELWHTFPIQLAEGRVLGIKSVK